uniref:Uncharacterized protein n=1 Tax=Lactuca sativa TaxID=4236 RepID=A0A9R1VYV5_LACSA|nr:hypothetical protein LSAT_V11C400201450 [Lactuca sativa]
MVGEFMEALSPNIMCDAQGLNEKLTTLSRFISKSIEKTLLLFRTLKGCIEKSNFQWTTAVQATLQQIKASLHELPTLANSIPDKKLQIYLLALEEAISAALIVEKEGR